MNVGDLVKNKRARIGIPKGTMGYISKIDAHPFDDQNRVFIYNVTNLSDGKERRSLLQDLEKVNESR